MQSVRVLPGSDAAESAVHLFLRLLSALAPSLARAIATTATSHEQKMTLRKTIHHRNQYKLE